MKTHPLLAAAFSMGVLLASSAFALTPSDGYTALKVIQTSNPMFPLQLLTYRTGEARLAINVDDQGVLKETLVLGYTQKAFADAALAAVKTWRFEPARLNGQPVGAVAEFTFNFETKGAVISLTAQEAMETIFNDMRGNRRYEYGLALVRELDSVPTPISAVTPAYPLALSRDGAVGAVSIDFFIDETGAVRMPAVTRANDFRLADLAVAALQQWKFAAPTRRGDPVPVRVSQSFNFVANTASPARASR